VQASLSSLPLFISLLWVFLHPWVLVSSFTPPLYVQAPLFVSLMPVPLLLASIFSKLHQLPFSFLTQFVFFQLLPDVGPLCLPIASCWPHSLLWFGSFWVHNRSFTLFLFFVFLWSFWWLSFLVLSLMICSIHHQYCLSLVHLACLTDFHYILKLFLDSSKVDK
jgi:hypothetical protein